MARLSLAILVGLVCALVIPRQMGRPLQLVLSWDVAALVLLALAWRFILRYDAEATRRRAAAVDPGRNAVWAIVLVASSVSLFASIVAVRLSKRLSSEAGAALVLLSLLAVLCAWLMLHTAFALRYAHLYYREDGRVGGLRFPGHRKPADIDFAYFAFSIGMTFGATDVLVTESRFARAVLGHGLLSFGFNTGILALALNLVFSMLG